VAEAIRAQHRDVAVELVAMATRGDRRRGALGEAGGKGLFTRELEQALRSRRAALAVHSAKDLPAVMPAGLAIVAVPPREDPRDALVTRAGGLSGLRPGATVGTGSLRRRAQLLALRDDLRVVPLRGNVETRLRRAIGDKADLDAVVLAMAGLVRSGLAARHAEHVHPLDVASFVPAAGQGALAVQALRDDAALADLVAPLNDPRSGQALEAERRALRRLGADCRSCVAVHVAPQADGWCGLAMVAGPDGSGLIRLRCIAAGADEAADALLEELTARGAEGLLAAE
jgi:hydroxymethylbilane synthase